MLRPGLYLYPLVLCPNFCQKVSNSLLLQNKLTFTAKTWALSSVSSLYWHQSKFSLLFFYFRTKVNKKMLCVLTIAMICSKLASLWKFQYFRRPIYSAVEHPWWSFYCKYSKLLSTFTKKLHHRCLLGF